jgi:KaiC/GvpD/RAD55 family RecA-like ATPase/DNA-binding response OmpR family regulator
MAKTGSLTGFTGLDVLSGGLSEGATYLVYGPSGTGKSTFALTFLHQGLVQGETAALVTAQVPEALLHHARAYGIELEPFVDAGQLLIFDYSDNMDDKLSRLLDPAEIVGEFQSFLGSTPLRRLVLDPVTPLLGSAGAAHCRAVVHAFSLLEATCLFVADGATGERVLSDCKNSVHGVLRFTDSQPGHSVKVLSLEKFPELREGPNELTFEVRPSFGLLETAAPAAPAPVRKPVAGTRPRATASMPVMGSFDRQPRILLIHPDRERRAQLRDQLSGEGVVLEAHGAADGFGLITVENPDLIVVSLALRGVSGLDVAHKVRQNGRNIPIVAVGATARRASDSVRAYQAGIDAWLPEPVSRLELLGCVLNLLGRSGVVPASYVSQRLRITERPANQVTTTTDFEVFRERLREEVEFAGHQATDMVMFAMRSSQGPVTVEELSGVISFVARDRDLIYVGPHGVAGVLLDAAQLSSFLNRFRQRWHGVAPAVTELHFDGSEGFTERACAVVSEVAGTSLNRLGVQVHAA